MQNIPKNQTISTEQVLRDFGLNDKEVGFYLTALNLGEANMSDLSRKAGLKRSSCYLIFKSLQDKGLMGSVKTPRGLLFSAASPESLLSKARVHMDRISMIIPELQAIAQKQESRPKFTYYEGEGAYRLAVEDCLKKPGITIRHIGSLSELHRTMGEEYDLKHFMPRRVNQKIFLKALYFHDTTEQIKSRNHDSEFREIRYIPMKYRYDTAMLIYENKVIISSSQKELVTVVIESEEIAKSEQMKFDLMWDLIGTAK